MAANTFGHSFRVTTFGESHGPAVGCVIDGCPPGHALDVAALQHQLGRRRPGQSRLVTQRQESDQVEVLSGVEQDSGVTLGTPICLLVRNQDARPKAYAPHQNVYRPSHADFTYDAKFGVRAWQGGGRSSARETIGRVAAGAVAEQVLQKRFESLSIVAWVERIHEIDAREAISEALVTRELVDQSPTRCPDANLAQAMEAAILRARKEGDSLGGTIRVAIRGVPPGLGDPVFDKLSARLAYAMASLPACKGVEIGSGFASANFTGSQHNDPFEWRTTGGPDPSEERPVLRMTTQSNHSGGIQGGISNGMPIEMRLAFKPTATILRSQATGDNAGRNVQLAAEGRHDPCVLPRAVPIVESMAALVLMDAWLTQRGQVGDPWPGVLGPIGS